MPLLSFGKSEKLKSRKAISRLFREGKSFSAFPLRVIFFYDPSKDSQAPLFSCNAPKRNFKTAVQRNKLKRKIREAYRLQKHDLINALPQGQLEIMILYTSKEAADYSQISKAMTKAINKIKTSISG